MNIQEIISKENLKPLKLKDLKAVIDVFNKYFFNDPFKSSKKEDIARIVGEIAIDDQKFHAEFFDPEDPKCFQNFDDLIDKNATYNYQIDPELSPEEFKKKSLPCPMIRPVDIDNEQFEGLNESFLKTIEELTGVNYFKMYGFGVEEPALEEKPLEKEVEAVEKEPEMKVESQGETKLVDGGTIYDVDDHVDENPDKSIICSTGDLLSALEAVSSGMGNLENENLIKFETDSLRTYSNNISVVHPFISGIEGAVIGKEMLALIKKLPEATLTLSQDDDKLYIKGVKDDGDKIDIHFNFNALRMPPVVIPHPDQPGWKDLPSDFGVCANIACMSTSTKARNFVYNCISVVGGDIYACEDGRKGVAIKMQTEFDGHMNIHGKLAKVLVNYNLEKVYNDETFFHFLSSEGTTLSLKQYADGNFSKIFFDNLKLVGETIEIPKSAKKVTERAAVLSGKKSEDYISIEITKDKMQIIGMSEAGSISEEIPMENNEIEAKFHTNPALLSELFGKMDSMDVCEDYVIFSNGEINCWISKVIPV
jgi:hypothetical protein